MSFDGQDIDSMFAEAAGAAEDTGEKGLEVYGNNSPKEKQNVKADVVTPVEVKQEPKHEPKQEPKVEEKKQEPKKVEPVREPVKEVETKPLINERPSGIINTSKGITEDSISKILDMNKIFAKFDDTQKDFVSGYFRLEEGEKDVSKVIYGALIASQRDLDALSKIVNAKGFDPAGRAFFLMGLDNSTIEDVFEQVELLTGELGKSSRVTDSNKLETCKKVESVISAMPKDVFTYIEKLQVFTNRAMEK